MARIEIEVDEAGDIVGDVPEALKAIHARIESTAHGAGYGKGAQKAAEEAKAQIESAVREAQTKFDADAPIKAAKYGQMENDYKGLQTRVIEQEREHSRTLKDQGEKHARELLDRADRQKKFADRIVGLTNQQLRADARAAGARDESLDELEVILAASIGYSDDMEPYVKNPDGSQRTVQGKPVTVSAYVKEYLDGHTHHRKPASGQGGGARGGASMHGGGHSNVSQQSAEARIHDGDRSAGAINELFEATRRKAS